MMFGKLLVPLDGSEMAENALAPAFRLARQFGSEVVLVRIIVPERMMVEVSGVLTPLPTVRARGAFDEAAEARAYLEAVKKKWAHTGAVIHTRTPTGAPTELIAKVARDERVDVIVMSTHGRSGVSRLLYGSVAEAVLRGARTPMLLIPTLA